MSDLAASVRARLLNIAKAQGVDFHQVLVRFALERILYRLTRSQHSDRFVLKGALLFTVWYDTPHRSTRDADMLGFGSSDPASSTNLVTRDIARRLIFVYTLYITCIGHSMTTSASGLLLKFRSRNTQFGVTRETVKAMAAQFDLSETEVVHMALSRMAKDELPAYDADDGPLLASDMKALTKIAQAALPKGKAVKTQNLF